MNKHDRAHWLQQVPSPGLLALEQQQVARWMPLVRRATVVQLGGLRDQFNELHQAATYYCGAPSQYAVMPSVWLDYQALPFRPESVDLLLLVHVLETVEHPTVLLKEAFDVLAPNGKLILFCLNAWSYLTIAKILGRAPEVLAQMRTYSPAQLQRWLGNLGFCHLKDKTLGFGGWHSEATPGWSHWFEVLGQMTIPMLGTVSVFLVEKRVYAGLASLRYHWQPQRAPFNVAAEPSVRIKTGSSV